MKKCVIHDKKLFGITYYCPKCNNAFCMDCCMNVIIIPEKFAIIIKSTLKNVLSDFLNVTEKKILIAKARVLKSTYRQDKSGKTLYDFDFKSYLQKQRKNDI